MIGTVIRQVDIESDGFGGLKVHARVDQPQERVRRAWRKMSHDFVLLAPDLHDAFLLHVTRLGGILQFGPLGISDGQHDILRTFLPEEIDVIVVEALIAAARKLRFGILDRTCGSQVDLHLGRGPGHLRPGTVMQKKLEFRIGPTCRSLGLPEWHCQQGQEGAEDVHNKSNMAETRYRGRRATSIENENLRVTVLHEGGHIAEILDKKSGVNPLWTPPWSSIEPSTYDRQKHPEYGADAESKLLSGIMGHNVCLDIFGGPSAEEAAAGLTVHGEASVAAYEITASGSELKQQARLPESQLHFERTIRLEAGKAVVEISEKLRNEAATDRPIAWTQHVTLGPPFVERGKTQFRASATKSKVFEGEFGKDGYMKSGATFDWPMVPGPNGGHKDLRVYNDAAASAGFTTHLMDPHHDTAYFLAWSPASRVVVGYIWHRADFPWLGIWEENHSRTAAPWNGHTLTRGMEFGASPMPETRRQMIERGSLFGMPAFRWIPARSTVEVRYCAAIGHADAAPEALLWNAAGEVRFES